MATVYQMARTQSYQEQYGYGANSSSSGQSMDEVYKQRAEAHMQELRNSGYLAEEGDNSYKVIVPISDDVKAEIEAHIKNAYENQQGWYLAGQESVGDISYAYTQTLEPADRLSAGWSVNQYYFEIADKYREKVNETNPNWPYDNSSYDPSIFDDFNPISLDTKV